MVTCVCIECTVLWGGTPQCFGRFFLLSICGENLRQGFQRISGGGSTGSTIFFVKSVTYATSNIRRCSRKLKCSDRHARNSLHSSPSLSTESPKTTFHHFLGLRNRCFETLLKCNKAGNPRSSHVTPHAPDTGQK